MFPLDFVETHALFLRDRFTLSDRYNFFVKIELACIISEESQEQFIQAGFVLGFVAVCNSSVLWGEYIVAAAIALTFQRQYEL